MSVATCLNNEGRSRAIVYQRIWVGQPQSCCHRVLKTTRRCANSRQHTSWQPKGSNCEKAPGHTISYDTLSHPEILLYVWQHIVAKVGEYNPKPGIPENTDEGLAVSNSHMTVRHCEKSHKIALGCVLERAARALCCFAKMLTEGSS